MQKNLVYVGTYTNSGKSKGIYVYRHDPSSGELTLLHEVADVESPSFLAFSPDQRYLYAVNETNEPSHVSSFAIDQQTGGLTFLSKQPSGGGQACHLCTDPSGRLLFVANHEFGTIGVFPVGDGGGLEPASQVVQHEGSGPGPTQTCPHAHFVTLDPGGQHLLCCDKGIDKVMVYQPDVAGRRLVPNDPPFGRLHAGAAPRHLTFHPNGRYAYVNGEADMTVTAFAYDGTRGAFEELHYLPTLPEGAARERVSTAQIVMHPTGRFLYVSNRGHDSIAIFEVDQSTGRLTAAGHVPSGGRTPRNFNVDPSGRFLYAANQNGDNIVAFQVDGSTGQLTPTGHTVEVGAPVCILFGPT
jgi:6-phosphogluconolactonase